MAWSWLLDRTGTSGCTGSLGKSRERPVAAPVNPGQLFAWVNTFGERSGFGPAVAGIVWGEITHGASLTVAHWSPQTGTLGNQRGISTVRAYWNLSLCLFTGSCCAPVWGGPFSKTLSWARKSRRQSWTWPEEVAGGFSLLVLDELQLLQELMR